MTYLIDMHYKFPPCYFSSLCNKSVRYEEVRQMWH